MTLRACYDVLVAVAFTGYVAYGMSHEPEMPFRKFTHFSNALNAAHRAGLVRDSPATETAAASIGVVMALTFWTLVALLGFEGVYNLPFCLVDSVIEHLILPVLAAIAAAPRYAHAEGGVLAILVFSATYAPLFLASAPYPFVEGRPDVQAFMLAAVPVAAIGVHRALVRLAPVKKIV
jgi:hypothetical protein